MTERAAGPVNRDLARYDLSRCEETSICDLSGAEQFLVWAIRWRASAQEDEEFAVECLRDSFYRAGMPEAHQALDLFVCATCPMRLDCHVSRRLGCWRLNLLEAHSLHAVACLQRGLAGEAWHAPRRVCPEAQLQRALESLQELGNALARNGGTIQRWRSATTAPGMGNALSALA